MKIGIKIFKGSGKILTNSSIIRIPKASYAQSIKEKENKNHFQKSKFPLPQ
jgi:hypothetical protein